MVHFYQLFLNTDNVMLKFYTSLCQKAKCTLFVWSTVPFMVPYSGKFLHGANVHVFHGMLVNVKIQTAKISTKEL